MTTLPSGVAIEFGTTYDIVRIDLGVAHDNDEIARAGDVVSVISITGELDIRLNEKDEPSIEVDKLTRVVTKPVRFTRFYITNAAQAGKEALLYIGKEASFEVTPKAVGEIVTAPGSVTEATVAKQSRKQHQLTTAALAAGASYTSAGEDVKGYKRITGYAFADQASATDGLEIQQSVDGTNYDYVTKYTVSANTALAFSIELIGSHVRIKYTNGATAQTVFRLGTYLTVA